MDECAAQADAQVKAKLRETLRKLDFDRIRLADVVQFMREIGGVSVHVKWGALETVGVEKHTPVTLHLTNVTFARALRIILDDVGMPNPLDFVIEGGVVIISTYDDLSLHTVTRVYDVSDLVRPRELPAAEKAEIERRISLRLMSTTTDTSDTPGGSEPSSEVWEQKHDDIPPSHAERLETLADVIRSSVNPDSWREVSGTTGVLAIFKDKFVIAQTKKAHGRIRRLLAALRERTPTVPPAPAPKATAPTNQPAR